MRVLILGGTAFLGIALRECLVRGGHDVTLFNRQVTQPATPPGIRNVRGDRTRDLSALQNERFDAVIDTSGYLPHVVEKSARFFAERTARYFFISTISVYDAALTEIDENSPVLPLPETETRTAVTGDSYGPLKALCERVVASTFRRHATIVRPGLIVGPYDRSDRFTYWPVRYARGGEVLMPGLPSAAVQLVDVRDLAAFVTGLAERDAGGDYNVVSSPSRFTMGDVAGACATAARVPSQTTWVDDAFLVERGVEPWMELPLWIPPSLGLHGFMNVNSRRADGAGLRIRPLPETARDTLAWAAARPRDHVWCAGMTEERERELLAAWHAGAAAPSPGQ